MRFLEDYKWNQFTTGKSRKFTFRKSMDEKMVALQARSFKQRSRENRKVGGILLASILITFSLIVVLMTI
ncbi:MAG: hypothetical protein AAGA85_11550 [Bacteroidota bacterium]